MNIEETISFVKSNLKNPVCVESDELGKPLFLIKDDESTLYFAIGETENQAWSNAKSRIRANNISEKHKN